MDRGPRTGVTRAVFASDLELIRGGGAAFMRQKMSHILCSLELVYYETKIGRELTKDEKLQRYTNWDIGLNMETLNAYYYTAISQQKAAEQKSEAG